jgi:hypothetical protein
MGHFPNIRPTPLKKQNPDNTTSSMDSIETLIDITERNRLIPMELNLNLSLDSIYESQEEY